MENSASRRGWSLKIDPWAPSLSRFVSYGRQNPFDERDEPSAGGGYGGAPNRPPPQASYGQGPSPYGGARNNNYGGNNVEMAPMQSGSGGYGGSSNGGNSILNECSDIDRGIGQVEQNLNQLRNLHRAALGDTDTSSNSRVNRDVDALSSETMALYRSLVDRVRKVKSSPEASQPMNSRQVERVDRSLKAAINQYQTVEADFRREMQGQIARQFRIVRPDATDEEVSRAVDGAEGGQVFTQALMQSNRQGQASAALNNVKDRHNQILKIERQMTELAQLFQDMNTLVIQQEVAVNQIEEGAVDVVENLDKGNTEIETAVKTAYATRRKKWWCLGITIAIIIVVVIIVVVYLAVTGQLGNRGGGGGDNNSNTNNNQKRGVTVADVAAIKEALVQTVPNLPRHLNEALAPSAKFRRALREAA
ncbi:related to putative snare protein syn [Cephalotrichum gorgonifer]|uniref:Related to putative snare protein syn n=1 Tax=Cephalotrichum gorgonifer TaxID=2041049 RepID=A0AAE8SV98_9PEZI|nr:related to putative snare protein syn [Cephalotrichum gorgonifer]